MFAQKQKLVHAYHHGDRITLRSLLESKADPNWLDNLGTPNIATLRILFSFGLDPGHVDAKGRNSLHLLAQQKSFDMALSCQVLLHGVDPKSLDIYGRSAFDYAEMHGGLKKEKRFRAFLQTCRRNICDAFGDTLPIVIQQLIFMFLA